ncbi:helix-turn-helix transcriptional regulator [Nocardioides cheoyonin]|uniref:helix-turn-helix transcriptional regulator n=1 Tax=Nocardioides cheoyonin TaxID=3156615 RepID=UPI0032B3F997
MPISPAPVVALGTDGPLSDAWNAVRSGAIRSAAADLLRLSQRTADGTVSLSAEEQSLAAALQVETRLAVGDLAGASAAGDLLAAMVAPRAEAGCQVATNVHLGLGQLSEALGDHAAALHHFLAAGEAGGSDLLRPWRSGAAVALIRTGRRREGADLAREQVDLTSVTDDAHAHAVGLRALAITGADTRPVDVLRRAQIVAATTSDRRLQAQIHTDLAALMLLSLAGDRTEAVALLRLAETYAGAEGLWPLHTRVSRLLEHAGEQPRSLEDETLSLLTPAEQRVARLAAGGLTNRQIADRLLVTIKGVEWHLSRVYRKLGIASRGDLVGLISTRAS